MKKDGKKEYWENVEKRNQKELENKNKGIFIKPDENPNKDAADLFSFLAAIVGIISIIYVITLMF